MHFDFIIPVMDPATEMSYLGGIARRLQARGCSVGLLPMTRTVHPACLHHTPHVFPAYADFDAQRPVRPEALRRIESKYRLGSVNDHVAPERYYDWGERSYEALYRRTVQGFEFLESLLAQHTVSVFLNCIGGEIIRRCIARMADCGGPTNLIIDWTPFPGRIVITTIETGWDELAGAHPTPTPAERKTAEEFVAKIVGARRMFAAPSTLGLGWHHLRRAGERMFEERTVGVSLARLCLERAQRAVRRVGGSALYQQPKDGEHFFFFPLHQPNDSALTLRAPQFMQQEVLIAFIAERLLPHGTVLYVKPHVGARDAYPLPMLAKIGRLDRVRLVDPTLNSHDLIERADAVLVINSTVGFESLCHGRPTVVFGRPFYSGFGATRDVGNLIEANSAVREAIASPPDREAVIRFLVACFRSSAPGVCGNASPENVERIALAILEKTARLGKRIPLSIAANDIREAGAH
jgi:Capsule polysaccharide biosynthesis protein